MSFLGMLGYFLWFIDGYVEMCASLNRLKKKDVALLWGYFASSCGSSPRFSRRFTLQVDAFSGALGGVLLQDQGNAMQPVTYASRALNFCEQQLSPFEKEALSCFFFVWRGGGRGEFSIYIEHEKQQALTWLHSHPKQVENLRRCIAKLNNYWFSIIHTIGKDNGIMCENGYNSEMNTVEFCVMIKAMPEIFLDFKGCQGEDEECEERRKATVLRKTLKYLLDIDLIYMRDMFKSMKVFVPKKTRSLLLKYFHSPPRSGHMGRAKTKSQIKHEMF
ncbi:hypothetical protein PR048_005831 [Dryococelus australis]|uniref:Reverse transcriptase RNase H-like domain-containing protein n=1 Tax=Dryococelus australis TaxID=614101 RepID=A0ABQ9I9U7_9NEOP|nr:hypothetical protein PR048_005831 [Dryococelus australis]